jgi:uncharacterized membrane protein
MVALELFTRDGGIFLSRYAHYLAGITWIGLLWYFNFVQTPAFATFDAPARTEAISILVPRALWWFRWAAVFTVLSGFFILGFQDQFDGDYFKSPPGISISTGALLGIIMLANVWGVIWRNQKTVIASARGVREGQAADPAAADAGRRAALASRTNTVFSIPLLFFMAFTGHLAGRFGGADVDGSKRLMWWIPVLIVIVLAELNALGVIGGIGQGPTKRYLEKHQNAILTGAILAAVFYLWFEACFG